MVSEAKEFTETRYLSRNFTPEEKESMLQEMFSEQDAIGEKEDELDAFKKQVSAEIAQHEANVGVLKNKLRTGYEKIPVSCVIKYEENKAKYYRKDTGEFLDERPMSDREQMNLAGGFTDAEQIIRADSEKQMDEEAEEKEDE
jgi:hypothetical protein